MSVPVPHYLTIQEGGASKYEDEAKELVERLRADAVAIVVIGGRRGGGMMVKLRETGSTHVKVELSTKLVRLAGVLNPDGVD